MDSRQKLELLSKLKEELTVSGGGLADYDLTSFLEKLIDLMTFKTAYMKKATIVAPHGETMTGIYILNPTETEKELKARIDALEELNEIYKKKLGL